MYLEIKSLYVYNGFRILFFFFFFWWIWFVIVICQYFRSLQRNRSQRLFLIIQFKIWSNVMKLHSKECYGLMTRVGLQLFLLDDFILCKQSLSLKNAVLTKYSPNLQTVFNIWNVCCFFCISLHKNLVANMTQSFLHCINLLKPSMVFHRQLLVSVWEFRLK